MERNPDYPNLLMGGVPGHDGSNAGRISNSLKSLLGEISEKSALKMLVKVTDETELAVLCRTLDVTAKYTLGQKIVVEQIIESRIRALAEMTTEFIAIERFQEWHSQAMSILIPSQDVPLTLALEPTDDQS